MSQVFYFLTGAQAEKAFTYAYFRLTTGKSTEDFQALPQEEQRRWFTLGARILRLSRSYRIG